MSEDVIVRDLEAHVAREAAGAEARVSNTMIQLRSKRLFDLAQPERVEPTILDIAHALGALCRFTGHTSEFYSVAEHCVLASEHAPSEHAYAALMHDIAEAVIGDVSTPLKRMLPDYRAVEARIEAALFALFDVPNPLPPAVKAIDKAMLAAEQRRFMSGGPPFPRTPPGGIAPLFQCWSPTEARMRFLNRFYVLRGRPC